MAEQQGFWQRLTGGKRPEATVETPAPTSAAAPRPITAIPEDVQAKIAAFLEQYGESRPNEDDITTGLTLADEALEHNPHDIPALSLRGLLSGYRMQWENSITDYTAVLEHDPDNLDARARRGVALMNTRAMDEAVEDFEYVLDHDPDHILANLGFALSLQMQQCFDAALDGFTKVIAQRPDHVGALVSRGQINFMLNEYQASYDDFTRAVQLTKTPHADLYVHRGNVAAALDRYEDAIADYTESIFINPENATAFHNRGIAYFDTRRFLEATKDLSKAIDLDPEKANSYAYRAQGWLALGNVERCREDVRRCQELGIEAGEEFLAALGAAEKRAAGEEPAAPDPAEAALAAPPADVDDAPTRETVSMAPSMTTYVPPTAEELKSLND